MAIGGPSIEVNDSMQQGYVYELAARIGREFDADCRP